MKIEQAHIDQIKIAFEKMQTKLDLLQLLNEVKPLVYGENTVPFQLKQVTWYANPKLAKNRYSQFTIKKKSGADRTINAPVAGLKAIQKVLSVILQCVYQPHQAAMGFVKDKSIVDNAGIHVGNKYVYNIDLKDFFPSIEQARVWKCLQLQPFNLNDKNIIVKEEQNIKIYSLNEVLDETKPTHYRLVNSHNSIRLHLIKRENNTKEYATIKIDKNIIFKEGTTDEKLKELIVSKDNYVVVEIKSNQKLWYLLSKKNNLSYSEKLILYSRQNLANIIVSLCCTEMEVERKNTSGEWEKVMKNVLPQGAPTSPILTNVICQRLDYLLSGVAKRFGLKYSRYADDITFSSLHNVYQSDSDFIKEIHRIITEQGFHIKESKTRLQKEGYRKEVTGLLVNDKVNVHKRYIKQIRMWLYYWETYGYERAYGFFVQQYSANKVNNTKGKPDMANVIGGKLDYLKMVKGAENKLYLKLRERYIKLTSKYNFIERVINAWEKEGIETAMDLFYLNNNHIINQDINQMDDIDFDDFDEIPK